MAETVVVPPELTARALLKLNEIGRDVFRAEHLLDNHVGAVFGGQLLGQALAAATRSADGRAATSINGFFLRAGRLDQPIDYHVARLQDGRRFAVRQVRAVQAGRVIFTLQASFEQPGDGAAHQVDRLPQLPAPEDLPNLAEFAQLYATQLPPRLRQILGLPFPIELRPAHPERFLEEAIRDFWFSVPSAAEISVDGDHRALLAMMSDYWLPGSIAVRHNSAALSHSVTSLNHSLWLHAPVRANEWLLFRTTSPWSGGGRGIAHGRILDRAGRLVATAMQDALVQPIAEPAHRD